MVIRHGKYFINCLFHFCSRKLPPDLPTIFAGLRVDAIAEQTAALPS